jgi:hypothetical protein
LYQLATARSIGRKLSNTGAGLKEKTFLFKRVSGYIKFLIMRSVAAPGFLMVVHAGFPAIAFNPSVISYNLGRSQYPLTMNRCFGGIVPDRRRFATAAIKMAKNEFKTGSKWKLPGVAGVPIQHYIDQYGRCAYL